MTDDHESQRIIIEALQTQQRLMRRLLDQADARIAAFETNRSALRNTWNAVRGDALMDGIFIRPRLSVATSFASKLRAHDDVLAELI